MKVVKLFRAQKLMIQMPKENKEQSILSTQVLLTKVNGSVDSEMEMVRKNGQMELYILDNGTTTEPKVKENSFILTVMCMKVTG